MMRVDWIQNSDWGYISDQKLSTFCLCSALISSPISSLVRSALLISIYNWLTVSSCLSETHVINKTYNIGKV